MTASSGRWACLSLDRTWIITVNRLGDTLTLEVYDGNIYIISSFAKKLFIVISRMFDH